MASDRSVDPIKVKVMNDYGAFPVWVADEVDGEDLALSTRLTEDLEAFAKRWDASIPDETFDDRFDHLPVIRSAVDAARAVRNSLDKEGRLAAEAEDRAIRAQGEALATQVQAELGPRYRVVYVH